MSFKYVLRRSGFALLAVYIAVTLNFILFHAAPGSPVDNFARVPFASSAVRAQLEREFGLNQPLWQQYTSYLHQLALGNLGISFQNRQSVAANLISALSRTIPMVLLGTLMALVLGIILGSLAAWRRGRADDIASTGLSLIFYGLPVQWIGMLLILLLGGLLPTGGYVDVFAVGESAGAHIADVFRHMLLPSFALALSYYGSAMLISRSAMLETLAEDYVLTAKAKGLSDREILLRHASRNVALPISTLVALSLGFVAGGAVLVETTFSWPGIGRALYEAVLARDYPMLEGGFLVITLVVIGCNYLIELIHPYLDPRVAAQ